MSREFPRWLVWGALGALAFGNVVAIHGLFSDQPSLSIFAAGALLKSDGRRLLIDTGTDASVLRSLGEALPPWQRRIDAVFLTSDKGRAGLAAVAARYAIGAVLRFGTDIPYGSRISLGKTALVIAAPGRYRLGGFSIASSTPPGTYEKW